MSAELLEAESFLIREIEMDESRWEFTERLLRYLTEVIRIDLELACEIVSRIAVEEPLRTTNLPELVASHASELVRMYDRVHEMIRPLFTKPHSPTYNRWRPVATAMFLNMVSNYRITSEDS